MRQRVSNRAMILGTLLIAAALPLVAAAGDAKDPNPPSGGEQGVGPRATGGPDSFGYIFIDSNEAGGPVFSWVELSGSAGATQVALGDDDSAGPISLGFTFPYYGQSQTDIYVASNGFLIFGSGSGDIGNDCPLPSTNSPNNIIALMWDDLDPGDTNDPFYYESFGAGSCPYAGYAGACFVAEFSGFHHYPGGTSGTVAGTFEAILMDNGDIVMQFQDAGAEQGSGSSTGIENSDGTDGLNYACNTSGSLTDGLAILFQYPAAPTPTPAETPVPGVPIAGRTGLVLLMTLMVLGGFLILRRRV